MFANVSLFQAKRQYHRLLQCVRSKRLLAHNIALRPISSNDVGPAVGRPGFPHPDMGGVEPDALSCNH
jgi:hypothetical protein